MYGFMDVCEYVWIFFMEYLLCGSSSIGWLLWKYSDWGITGSTTHGYCSVVVVVVKVMVMVMVIIGNGNGIIMLMITIIIMLITYINPCIT